MICQEGFRGFRGLSALMTVLAQLVGVFAQGSGQDSTGEKSNDMPFGFLTNRTVLATVFPATDPHSGGNHQQKRLKD